MQGGAPGALLTLDISSSMTGWCVYKDGSYKKSGTLQGADAKRPGTERIIAMADSITGRLEVEAPDIIVIEDTYARSGFNSSKLLDRIHGAVIYRAAFEGIPVSYIAIPTWRAACGFPSTFALKKSGIKSCSKEYKRLSIRLASEITGYTITDDNEADAICIGAAWLIRSFPEDGRLDYIKEAAGNG